MADESTDPQPLNSIIADFLIRALGEALESDEQAARPVPHQPAPPDGLNDAVDRYLQRCQKRNDPLNMADVASSREFKQAISIAESHPVESILYLLALIAETLQRASDVVRHNPYWWDQHYLPMLLPPLVRKTRDFSSDQMLVFLDLLIFLATSHTYRFPWSYCVKQLEAYAKARELGPDELGKIGELAQQYKTHDTPSAQNKIRARLAKLGESSVDETPDVLPPLNLKTEEPWVVQLQASIQADCETSDDGRDADQWSKWIRLLAHAGSSSSSKPSKRWMKTMAEHVSQVGPRHYSSVAAAALDRVGEAGPTAPVREYSDYDFSYELDPTMPLPAHVDLLRGLCWSLAVCQREDLIDAVGRCGEVCYRKIPQIGPRSPKVGNACVVGLSESGQAAAIARLSRLSESVKHASSKKQIAKALDRAAEAAGLSREDLEEAAVPDCGFTSLGEKRTQLGDFIAVARVSSRFTTELTWESMPDESGKTKSRKTVPKSVKTSYTQQWKQFKAATKLADTVIATWRSRLESFPLLRREHTWDSFRTRFLLHPILGLLARHLIWHVDDEGNTQHVGLASDDGLIAVDGQEIRVSNASAIVRLWHPIESTADEVLAWRRRLESCGVTQPFKQAHREVYRLTDAERDTESYSNRFAAHILKQHQFKALCDARDWKYALQGSWDGGGETPTKLIDAWQLRAEYWVEIASDETGTSGVATYLSTDQVRFLEQGESAPQSLEKVPALPFSEIMRDVDLFVGVAGIGADPNWQDGGDERYHGYWHSTSFGDLSETGETRRDVLENLIPRLRIADRCELEKRFLRVRGTKRTYKIHLGSSNILMEPNDEYLCIVPDQSKRSDGKVALPFEGDRTLSIILSKAFLLAEDHKIKDRTILSQIEPLD